MNEHKNIITIEDEIKEFSDKPVKSSALYKKVKELESNAVPDASEASVGDVLSLDEDKKAIWSEPSQELPDIQSGDAGKVLKVNSGATGVEWGAGGGGDVPIAIFSQTSSDWENYYARFKDSNGNNLTITQVKSQKYLVIEVTEYEYSICYNTYSDGDGKLILTALFLNDSGKIQYLKRSIASSGLITTTTKECTVTWENV